MAFDAPANARDDAAAATCDNVAADKPVEEDAAVDDVAAFCPFASNKDAVCDARSSTAEAVPNELADWAVGADVEFRFIAAGADVD